jgi:outer membrane protein assembly factor BamB
LSRLRKLTILALLGLLAACAGGTDNSEPPAPLTSIEEPLPLYKTWVVDTRAADNRAAYRLRPLIIGDRAYTIDTGGTVRAVELVNGRLLWRHKTGLEPIIGLGGNSQLLIATSRNGDVIAYRELEDGLETIWKAQLDSEIRAIPEVDGEQVFVRSVDGRLRSLSVHDGLQQWLVSRRVPALSLTGNSSPLVAGQLVISGFDDGKLTAYDRDNGKTQWETTVSLPSGRTEVERLVDLDGQFVMRDGVVYVVSFQGHLAAVQVVSGDLLWSRKFSSFQAIAIDDNSIYLSAENSDLWSIDRRTGSAFWKQDVLHARKITAPTIVGDKLVVADFEGFQHWFAKEDGKLLGRIRTTFQRNYVQPLVWQETVVTLDKLGFLASVSLQ